ncbi:hypothetical protein CPB84DRAFT_1775975 [Gymnopilus junonius]|uniref:F-box protein n=1 Tax=Gymnopilus junonius TaxID=109634 RepID=A0A9P5NPW6_GYMJU|nr:hypothetical protein CPB84DRAFT_1775975 [Gymnopilus junonius]
MRVDVTVGIQIPWKTFVSLNVCQRLECLDVCIDHLTAERLGRMCGKGEWHALAALGLYCNRVKLGETGLSLYDLRILAEHCPSLTILDITLETLAKTADDIQVLRDAVTKDRLQSKTNLRTLHIAPLTSRPDDLSSEAAQKNTRDAVAVARYIYWLFPYINEVSFPTTCDWFGGIINMLKGFRSIRREENSTENTN